jgi:calcineurin-like phosphoesterase family protein
MSNNQSVFVVSDTWFNRPLGQYSDMTNDEYNNMIIVNWNNNVSENDIVYVLGGFGISNCYDIVLKLKGEIHFLNSVFSRCDNNIKECVENSVNKELSNRIFFENNQIIAIPEVDCVLSYLPLRDWVGKSTNTYCFHGYTDKHELNENNISCRMDLWNNCPVNINDIKNNFSKFRKILSK